MEPDWIAVRVKVRPGGLVNGQEWPEVGGELRLPRGAAEDMAKPSEPWAPDGWLEIVEAKVEKRPATRAKIEKRA